MNRWFSSGTKRFGIRNLFLLVLFLFPIHPCGCAPYGAISSKEPPPLTNKTLLKRWKQSSVGDEGQIQGPLTLDRAVREALNASPELEQIQQRIHAASEQVRQADAAFYPRLILSEDFNVTDNPVFALMDIINQRRLETTVNFNQPGQQQNFSTRIQAEWSLFEGGTRIYDRKAALKQKDSIEAERMAARNQLVAKVSQVYYHWLQALDFIGVGEQALEAAETDQRLGEARYRAQVALASELFRLRARTAEVRGNLVTAQTSARRLKAALERLLARPIRPEESPVSRVSLQPFEPEGAAGDADILVAQALEKRPEIEALRSLIEAARQRVRSQQGGFLPRIATSAQYQWDSEDFTESAESWLVGIKATWSIFEGGITLSRIREAKIRLKEIEAKGEQLALDIALEVHQATLAVQEAAEKIKVADERKKWAQRALDEVRHLYRNQVVTVDSLLQAEVSWNQAEVSYSAALFDWKIAQALLKQSLGDFADWMEERNG